MGIRRRIKQSANADQVTFKQAFDEFIAEKEAKNLSNATIRNYVQSYEYFLDFHNLSPKDSPSEITQSHFFKWIKALKQEGAKPTTINHYLRDCRAFFYWCMDSDRCYVDPFKIQMIEGQEESIKVFSDQELAMLLEKPNKNDNFIVWRTWAIVNWVLGTGNRAATICDVKIDDIDFSAKEIVLSHTKNKRAQIVPLSPALEAVLREYIRIWRDNGVWLFPNVGDEKLTVNSLSHSFAKYCKDKGVTKTSIHGLRHNFARGWVKNNGNMFTLQRVLGHSTLDMTKKYVNLFSDDLKTDYNKYSLLDTMKRNSSRMHVVKRSE